MQSEAGVLHSVLEPRPNNIFFSFVPFNYLNPEPSRRRTNMLVAFVLIFVVAVGGDSAAAAAAGFATYSDDHRDSSDAAAPPDYNKQEQHNNTNPDEKPIVVTDNEVIANVLDEDSRLTILGIICKGKQSLEGLSDALEHPAQTRMLAPIQDLVDYIEFVQLSPANLRPPNNTMLHIKTATLIKNLIAQTRLTSDADVIKSMQSILTRILSLVHERHHHHGEDEASEDADGTVPTLPDFEVDRSVANDFFHALANPRRHTQAEYEICYCDRCPDCCRCCPDCSEPPAGDLPPVPPPPATAA